MCRYRLSLNCRHHSLHRYRSSNYYHCYRLWLMQPIRSHSPHRPKNQSFAQNYLKFKIAPLETDISLPLPKLFAIPAVNVPALIVVAPVYVFALDKVRMPDPACVNEPLPLMRLPIEILSVRLNCNAALSVTLFVPNDPLVLPAPTCNVPALMVVIPP